MPESSLPDSSLSESLTVDSNTDSTSASPAERETTADKVDTEGGDFGVPIERPYGGEDPDTPRNSGGDR